MERPIRGSTDIQSGWDMTKKINIYAFDMNCVGHINHGLWTHPRDRSSSYTSLDYWVNLAKIAERGKLDGIFLADIVGVYDVYKGGPETAIAAGAQVPGRLRRKGPRPTASGNAARARGSARQSHPRAEGSHSRR